MPAGSDETLGLSPDDGRRIRGRIAAMRAVLQRDTSIVLGAVLALNLLRVVSSMVLTRLLAPDIFGAVGMIWSVMFVLAMVSDLGFQAFVVRHRDADERGFLDAIWTIRLIRAAVLTLVLAVLADPVSRALDKPVLAMLVAVSSLQFLIEGFSSLSLITALRDRQLLRLSLLELAVAMLQLTASIVLAVLWRDAWAIVVAMLLSGVGKVWLSYAVFPGTRRQWRIDRRRAGELWAFARFVTGSSIISMLLLQADKVVLTRLLSLDAFGLYVLAGNLAIAPMAFTSAYASRVLYPLYVQTWHDRPEALRSVFYAARRRASLLYMAGAGGLIGGAPALVAILYDDRYAGAAHYLTLLAIAPMLALGSAAANEALTASGHVRATFHASLVRLGWLGVTAPSGFLLFGPIGLIAAVGTVEIAPLVYGWSVLYRIGVFDPKEELILLGAAGIGVATGGIASGLLLPLL